MTRSAQASAYDEDFFTWTQDQAAALRAGERSQLDVEHLAEEIEDLGKRDLREVTSMLRLLLLHLIEIAMEPNAPSVPHWRSEAREFRRAARRTFTPGMRPLIDLPALWQEAAERLGDDRRDKGLPKATISACPFQLADLFSVSFDLDTALAKATKEFKSSAVVQEANDRS